MVNLDTISQACTAFARRSAVVSALLLPLPIHRVLEADPARFIGVWNFHVRTPAGATLPTVEFLAMKSDIAGTYTSSMGQRRELAVSVVGDTITFAFVGDQLPNSELRYRGVLVSRDTLRGTVMMAHRSVPFEAVRQVK